MPKRLVLWTLFLLQFGCSAVFGISQFWRMLSSTQGISITWFGAWEVFLILNLWLSWRAHQTWPSLATAQTLFMYAFSNLMLVLDLSVMLLHHSWQWDARDTLNTLLVGAGAAGTLMVAAARGHSIAHPLVKGWLAVFFKSVPQLVLAWNIHLAGGAGLALAAILAGHVTILSRLGQLIFSIREAGWDQNRMGSLISEIPNELSWMLVTVVWLLR